MALEGKLVAARRFGVLDHRDAAIDDEPSSTSTVRLRVLNTSTRGFGSAMARTCFPRISLNSLGPTIAAYHLG
jgi:hypothetical protein